MSPVVLWNMGKTNFILHFDVGGECLICWVNYYFDTNWSYYTNCF